MIIIRFWFRTMFFLIFTVSIHPTIASEYMPWVKGDNAVYTNSFNNNEKIEIDQQIGRWLLYTNFAGLGPIWIKTDPDNEKVYIRNSETGRKQLLVDFDDTEGTTTRIDVAPCNVGTVEIASKIEQINTPAGSFKDVIRLDFESSCADGGLLSAWFARSVGVVKWESSNIIGIVTSEMFEGTINGKDFPGGLLVKAVFPDPIVVIDAEPFVHHIDMEPLKHPVKQVATVDVQLIIKNNTDRDLTYVFNSGQHFEIMLIDENGKTISRWSHGRGFTEAIETRILKQGEIWSLGGALKLRTDDGEDAPAGSYTMQIEMTSSPDDGSDHKPGSERISATTPLTIRHAL